MSKRKGRGSRKGGAYERTLSVLLSLWVSSGRREDLFWRTAQSGGRATIGRRKGKDLARTAGDIGAIDPRGEWLCGTFLIEAKHYAQFKWPQDIYDQSSATPKKKTLRALEIALHTREEAAIHGRRSFLCLVRENHRPDAILTDSTGLAILSAHGAHKIPILITFPEHGIHVLRLDSVIPSIPYRDIEEASLLRKRRPILRRR